MTIPRGYCLVSYRDISLDLMLSIGKIQRGVSLLIKEGYLHKISGKNYMVLGVLDFDRYNEKS